MLVDTDEASDRDKGRTNGPDTRLPPTRGQNIKSSLATREQSTPDIRDQASISSSSTADARL